MNCRVCLGDAGDLAYHARCARELFGTEHVPGVDVALGKLHLLALAMVGHMSLPGAQRKIAIGLSEDRAALQLAAAGGRFLLKPQASTYPHLPENEHVTMRLARVFDIDVPPCGLVELLDGSLAYLVRRFDRPEAGGKLAQEDFCQLAGKPPHSKYDGSGELCARLVRKYATEPTIELLRLFRRLVFVWWTGNGDMHLKNFALLNGADGIVRLSPAYDLLCTRLAIPDDQLALPVCGKRDNLKRRTWLDFAAHIHLPQRAAERVIADVARALPPAIELVGRSFLPADEQATYVELLRERAATIAA